MPKGGHNRAHLEGQRFGRLVVLNIAPYKAGEKSRWRCICDCGREHIVACSHLTSGLIRSCGCYKSEVTRARSTKHGHFGKPEYQVWLDMHKRCSNPKDKAFKNYGARGIAVCERWRSFDAFYSDMGQRPHGGELDRKDNDGNYEPLNCRWATHTQNCRNQRRSNYFDVNGERLTLPELAERYGLNVSTLYYRLMRLGWPLERALLQSLRPPKSPAPPTNTAGQSYKKSA